MDYPLIFGLNICSQAFYPFWSFKTYKGGEIEPFTAVNIEFGNGVLRIMTTYDLTKKLDVIKDLHVKQLYEKMILSFRLNQVQVNFLSLIPWGTCD